MKKSLLYCLMIVSIFVSLYFVVFNFYSLKNYSYMIFDKNNIWRIKDNKIEKISSKNLRKINFSELDICNQKCEKGYINNKEYFEVYNDNLEKINLSSEYLIKKGRIEIKNYYEKKYNDIGENDKILILKVLKENNLDYKIDNLFITKISIDNNRSAYSLEPYLTDESSENSFSLVFISDKFEYEIIYMKKNASRLSSLNKVIDINNDNLLEVILLSDVPGSAGNECYSLYQYNKLNSKYVPIIDCEGE